MTTSRTAALFLLAGVSCTWAQTAPASQTAEQRQAKLAMTQPEPAPKDDPAFESIFDGKSMAGWEGDTKYWRIADGAITGETTAENPLKQNTFVIWKGGSPGDFELKLEYRLSAQGNSGVQYRSEVMSDRKFGLRGYQADIDSANRYTGQIYEEGGRGFLALRGQATRIQPGEAPGKLVIGSLGESAALVGKIKMQDWNELHIIARGTTVVQILNGQVMSVLVDDDPKGRRAEGVIGMQIHTGPPMKIEYRNIRLKRK